MLLVSLAGYSLASLATALAPTLWLFALFQLVGRIFLIAGLALAMIYAAEEFPAERRGLAIGLVQASSGLGSVTCAGLVPLLSRLPLGWRGVFLFGVLPMGLLVFAGRLRETERFEAEAARRTRAPLPRGHIFSTPYRRRVFEIALIWALTYMCTQTSITFWKEFAVSERGFTEEAVGRTLALAAVLAMPLVFAVGKILDRLGRRPAAVLAFGSTILGVYAAYVLHDARALLGALAVGIFGINSVLPVLNAYTTELFPTELRSDAFAWANNLLGRSTYVLAPWLVGIAAGALGWSRAVSLTTLCALAALVLLWWRLPETKGQELEQTAQMDGMAQTTNAPSSEGGAP
jgi:putative MFS transporter